MASQLMQLLVQLAPVAVVSSGRGGRRTLAVSQREEIGVRGERVSVVVMRQQGNVLFIMPRPFASVPAVSVELAAAAASAAAAAGVNNALDLPVLELLSLANDDIPSYGRCPGSASSVLRRRPPNAGQRVAVLCAPKSFPTDRRARVIFSDSGGDVASFHVRVLTKPADRDYKLIVLPWSAPSASVLHDQPPRPSPAAAAAAAAATQSQLRLPAPLVLGPTAAPWPLQLQLCPAPAPLPPLWQVPAPPWLVPAPLILCPAPPHLQLPLDLQFMQQQPLPSTSAAFNSMALPGDEIEFEFERLLDELLPYGAMGDPPDSAHEIDLVPDPDQSSESTSTPAPAAAAAPAAAKFRDPADVLSVLAVRSFGTFDSVQFSPI